MRDDVELKWFTTSGTGLRAARVDGVPVVHVGGAGPVTGGIAFRVGSADEALTERGLTHLVEHLALHGQLNPIDHRNGTTGSSITQFFVSGTEDQVVAFLNHVCAALRELPLDRLDAERSIIGVEARGRTSAMDEQLVSVRYGATGFAVGSFREFGAETATAEDVSGWARRWFVRGNAVAWISTDSVPEGLDLRLPEGDRQPFVAPASLMDARPQWFAGPPGRVLVEAIVRRSTTAVLFSDVLTRALFRQLRLERGISYTAVAQYEPLDAELARVIVLADSAEDAGADLVDAVTDVLVAFRDGRINSSDIEDARRHGREIAAQIEASPDAVLVSSSMGFLLGGDPWRFDDLTERRDAVTVEDLAHVGREFWSDALWQTPAPPERADGVSAISPSTTPPIVGETFINGITREYVHLGDDGVSVVSGDQAHTVRFADCVLAIRWEDGGRALVGRDGVILTIEPNAILHFGESKVQRLDAGVPPEVVVRLPARPADQIPKPPGVVPPGLGPWALIVAFFVLVSGVPFAVNTINRVAEAQGPNLAGTVSGYGLFAVLLVATAAGLIWGWARRLRWARRQRVIEPVEGSQPSR